ncbi:hypothetical protein pb186bvf_020111 [Paramecium bursaria]
MEESLALETNKSISDAPEGVIMSDTRDRDTNLTMDEEVSSSSNQQIKFSYQLSDQDKNSQKLYSFINSVFDIFESIEAAGISLNDIFQQEEQYQAKIFADFLLSLFFWGSYLPIKHIYQKKLSTLLCQKLGFSKFSASLTKLDNFIKTEKQSCHMPIQIMVTLILKQVLNDLELIAIKFRLLRENFKKAIKAKSQSGVFQIEMKEQRDEEQSSKFGQKLMEPVNRLLGNFFPLTCGHNGILEQQESQVLEFHMHQAGIQF